MQSVILSYVYESDMIAVTQQLNKLIQSMPWVGLVLTLEIGHNIRSDLADKESLYTGSMSCCSFYQPLVRFVGVRLFKDRCHLVSRSMRDM